jgi:flagellar protein FliJ
LGKPVFRLESALRYRQGIEDQEMIKMAQASQVVKEQEATADRLNQEVERHYENYRSRGLSLTSLLQREIYLDQLNQRITRQAENVEQALQQLEVQRFRVVEASGRKKVLERLKEKDLEEFQMQVSKAEQKVLDDVGIAAYCYRNNQ